MNTVVVNLFAGPGAGKSTMAAGLFYALKSRDIPSELVTEYAKDLMWRTNGSFNLPQLYIFAKQHERVSRLIGKVRVVVTDSPLLLTEIYDSENNTVLHALALYEHTKHKSLNFLVRRVKRYFTYGRSQTETEALEIDDKIFKMLLKYEIPFQYISGDIRGLEILTNTVVGYLETSDPV